MNLTGIPIDAAEVGSDVIFLDATATVNEEHDVEVVLERYAPAEFLDLVLYLAVLLPDRTFATDWSFAQVGYVALGAVEFHQCSSSQFLQQRFNVCRKLQNLSGGWAATVVKITMSVWAPEETQIAFQVVAKNRNGLKGAATNHVVKVKLNSDVASVGAWAVSPVSKGPERCRFLASLRDLRAVKVGGEGMQPMTSATRQFFSDPRLYSAALAMCKAACHYVHRECPVVRSCAFDSLHLANFVPQFVVQNFYKQAAQQLPDNSGLRVPVLAARKASPALWRFLRCQAEAGLWRRLADICSVEMFWEFGDVDVLNCKFDKSNIETQPTMVMVEGLPGILRRAPDELDDKLMKGACDLFRARNASQATEHALQDLLFEAAVNTRNLQAVNLTLQHCLPHLRHKHIKKLWALQDVSLNVTGLLLEDFPQHLGPLLQDALNTGCEACLLSWGSSLPEPAACVGRASLCAVRNLSLVYIIGRGVPTRLRKHGYFEDPDEGNGEAIRLLSKLATAPCIPRLLTALRLHFRSQVSRQLAQVLFNLLLSSRLSLASLDVSSLSFEDARGEEAGEAHQFLHTLGQLHKLETLKLIHTSLSDTAVSRFLINASNVFPSLRALQLIDTSLPVTAVSGLLTSNAFPLLRALELKFASGRDRGETVLSQALASRSPCPLRTLDMSLCGAEDKDSLQLFNVLARCRNLTRLNFCRLCAISSSSIVAIQEMMLQFPKPPDVLVESGVGCTTPHEAARMQKDHDVP